MPIRKIDSSARMSRVEDLEAVEFDDDDFDDDFGDLDQDFDDEFGDGGYGPSPFAGVRNHVLTHPAWIAVAVEVVVVVVFGNQWMLDHLVAPAETSGSPIRDGLASGLGFFSWPVSVGGFGWFVFAGIAHTLVWFAVTFALAAPATRSAERGARLVGVLGAALVGAVAALLTQRVLSYPDVSAYYRQGVPLGSVPSFAQWVFLGLVPGAALLFVLVVGLLGAALTEVVAPRPASGVRRQRSPAARASSAGRRR